MEERKFIKLKKEEYGIKEYIKRDLGKGKISKLDIEYTPVGEKIIIHTSKPGLVIGRKGEKISFLTDLLRKRFKLENPHIEIKEIENPLFDAQLVADEIALALERMGNLKFKVIAYRKLQEIMQAGALGCEMRLTGKLPSDRAKSWRFAEGYLKKAGEPSKEIDRAQSTGLTKTGVIGIKVAIMSPDAKIYDKIDIDDALKNKIKGVGVEVVEEVVEEKPKKKSKNKVEKKVKKEKVEKKVEEEKEKVEERENSPERDKDVNEAVSGDVEEKVEEKSEVEVDDEIKELEAKGEVEEGADVDGKAIAIEQEIEEGVSVEDDKAIEKAVEEEKGESVKVEAGGAEKAEEGKDIKVEETSKESKE